MEQVANAQPLLTPQGTLTSETNETRQIVTPKYKRNAPKYKAANGLFTLTPQTVSAFTGLTGKGVIDNIKAGKIKGVHVGRRWYVNKAAFCEQFGLDEAEVDAYVDSLH